MADMPRAEDAVARSNLHRAVGGKSKGAARGRVRGRFDGIKDVGGGLNRAAVVVDRRDDVAQGLDGMGVSPDR